MPCYLVCNPTAGNATARQFVDAFVLPLLTDAGIAFRELGDYTQLAQELQSREILEPQDEGEVDIEIIVAGGDGTLHELINIILSSKLEAARTIRISFAIIPCGTANALYHSLFPASPNADDGAASEAKLHSLKAMLNRKSSRQLLTVLRTTADGANKPLFATVVASTALHASILHDSEALRATIPDISRFKVAAQQNIERWYDADVEFYAPKDGQVTIYDPGTKEFIPYNHADVGSSGMHGPFTHSLATVNVDRLEATFEISPLQRRTNNADAMLVTIVRPKRPKRDPSYSSEETEAQLHAQSAGRLMTILHAAYDSGKHVDLAYNDDGSLGTGGDSIAKTWAVEYIRCGGWKWTSKSTEASYLCVDGTIVRVSSAEARVHEEPNLQLYVSA